MYYELFPDKFTNKTNGVSPRRLLLEANPALAKVSLRLARRWAILAVLANRVHLRGGVGQFLFNRLGEKWPQHLDQLHGLMSFTEDVGALTELREIKLYNKTVFASWASCFALFLAFPKLRWFTVPVSACNS